jgi:hypothetical protein
MARRPTDDHSPSLSPHLTKELVKLVAEACYKKQSWFFIEVQASHYSLSKKLQQAAATHSTYLEAPLDCLVDRA